MNWWKSWRLKRRVKLFTERPWTEYEYVRVRENVVRKSKTHVDSLPLLVAALKDRVPDVSSMAAKKLGDIGDARAIGPLLGALGDTQAQLYEAAANALSAIDPAWRELPEARALIANCVSKLKNSDVQREIAARLLGRLGDRSTEGVLIEALRDPLLGVRETAAEALGELRTPAAVEPLNHIVNEKADQLRIYVSDDNVNLLWAVAKALGKIGDRRSIGPLTRMKEILQSKIVELRATEEASAIFGGRRFQAHAGSFEAEVAGIASEAVRRLETNAANAWDERFTCERLLTWVSDALRSLEDPDGRSNSKDEGGRMKDELYCVRTASE